jgi:hypothetical protein
MDAPKRPVSSTASAAGPSRRRVTRLSLALLCCADFGRRARLVEELQAGGTFVHATGDGLKALEVARYAPPQLALCAEDVESMRSVDLCRALANKGIPVLFLGMSGVGREDALAAGAIEYVPLDPFAADVARVARLLAVRQRGPGGEWTLSAMLSEAGGTFALLRAVLALGRSAILQVVRGDHEGEVRIHDGEVVAAQLGPQSAMPALHRLLLWQGAHFELRFTRTVRRPALFGATADLLADCEHFLRDCADAALPIGSIDAVYEQAFARLAQLSGRMPGEVSGLVRLFDGARSVADVIQDSPLRPFDTLRVLARLVDAGALRRVGGAADGEMPVLRPRKKPATLPPGSGRVGEWLRTPPRGQGRVPSSPALPTVAPDADGFAPRVSEASELRTAEPAVPVYLPAGPASVPAAPVEEVSLEQRIQDLLQEQVRRGAEAAADAEAVPVYAPPAADRTVGLAVKPSSEPVVVPRPAPLPPAGAPLAPPPAPSEPSPAALAPRVTTPLPVASVGAGRVRADADATETPARPLRTTPPPPVDPDADARQTPPRPLMRVAEPLPDRAPAAPIAPADPPPPHSVPAPADRAARAEGPAPAKPVFTSMEEEFFASGERHTHPHPEAHDAFEDLEPQPAANPGRRKRPRDR